MTPLPKSKRAFRPPAPASFIPPRSVKPATQSGPSSSSHASPPSQRRSRLLRTTAVDLIDDTDPDTELSAAPREDGSRGEQMSKQRGFEPEQQNDAYGQSRGPARLDDAWPVIQPNKKDETSSSQTSRIHTDQDEEEDAFWRQSTAAHLMRSSHAGYDLKARGSRGCKEYEDNGGDKHAISESRQSCTLLSRRASTISLGHRSFRIGEDLEVFPSTDSFESFPAGSGSSEQRDQSISLREMSEKQPVCSTPSQSHTSDGDLGETEPPGGTVATSPANTKPSIESPITDDSPLTSLSSLSLTDAGSQTHLGTLKRKRKIRRPVKAASIESDSDEDEAHYDQNFTKGGNPRKRAFYGATRMGDRYLKASEGVGAIVGGAKWPKKSLNTKTGLLCKGWVHWACAGLKDDQADPEDSWYCPPCDTVKGGLYYYRTSNPNNFPRAGEPTYWNSDTDEIRAKLAIIPRADDISLFRVEKIIGQKEVGRSNGRRHLRYLTLWEGWELCDATWEPEENFDGFVALWDVYHAEAQTEGKDIRKPGVILLEEAKAKWDDDGALKGMRSARYLRLGWPLGEGADGQ